MKGMTDAQKSEAEKDEGGGREEGRRQGGRMREGGKGRKGGGRAHVVTITPLISINLILVSWATSVLL